MTTERLEEFAVLANILNYSKAAEKLFISQPILSRHIKELERELGAALFVRDTHSVELTDEGKFLLKWVRPLLEKTERTVSALSGEQSIGKGKIHITCSEQTLSTQILTFIRSFIEGYPDIQLDLAPIITASKKELIYSCDVFLTPCDFLDMLRRDTEGVYLKAQQPLLAIPPFHHFGDMQEIRLEDLKGEDLIVPFTDEMFGPYARNALAATRKCHGMLRKIGAESAQAGLLMVELGVGVMLIPHHLKHRVYPQTRTIPVADPDCVFPIYAYLNRSADNPAAELFFEKLCENFKLT